MTMIITDISPKQRQRQKQMNNNDIILRTNNDGKNFTRKPTTLSAVEAVGTGTGTATATATVSSIEVIDRTYIKSPWEEDDSTNSNSNNDNDDTDNVILSYSNNNNTNNNTVQSELYDNNNEVRCDIDNNSNTTSSIDIDTSIDTYKNTTSSKDDILNNNTMKNNDTTIFIFYYFLCMYIVFIITVALNTIFVPLYIASIICTYYIQYYVGLWIYYHLQLPSNLEAYYSLRKLLYDIYFRFQLFGYISPEFLGTLIFLQDISTVSNNRSYFLWILRYKMKQTNSAIINELNDYCQSKFSYTK